MSTIPKPLIEQVVSEHGTDSSKWNSELQDLMNPAIVARPMYPSMSGQIKEVLDATLHFHWALDRCGSNPNHERVERLKAEGWRPATTNDCVMQTQDVVKGESEIRSGDRLLMCIPVLRWREIRKDQNLRAIGAAYPAARVNEGPMNMRDFDPSGRLNSRVSEETVEQIRSRASENNSTKIPHSKVKGEN